MVDGGDQARAFAERDRAQAGLNLSFGAALALMKGGARISRTGWGTGEGWIVLCREPAPGAPWIGFAWEDSDIIRWTPDHNDLLANDWMVLDVSTVDPVNVLRFEGADSVQVAPLTDRPAGLPADAA